MHSETITEHGHPARKDQGRGPRPPGDRRLGAGWKRADEWCNCRSNPRQRAQGFASLDESSYSGGSMGGDHPITWCQQYEGGLCLHRWRPHPTAYAEPVFRQHLLGGIRYAICAAQGRRPPRTGLRPALRRAPLPPSPSGSRPAPAPAS
ncbi:ThuA domain-containing protein [Streptomyces flavofungini]|uniref:ThuA domain-containing protein n=1 Tax=Streptomyces flavofungini TaxID=68200 RepID=UPI0027DDAF3C|nr:ThuA domain-containing protein [Streptomyces flavofungini]